MGKKKHKSRVVGYMGRLVGEPEISAWKPMSREEAAALQSLPKRAKRGWVVPVSELEDGREESREIAVAQTGQEPRSSEAPRSPETAPRATAAIRPPLPSGFESDSAQALVWQRPEAAAALVRSMLDEPAAKDEAPARECLAIVCVALGREVTAELFKFLGDREIEEITQAIAGTKGAPAQRVAQELEEFKRHLLAGEWVEQGGVEFARAALELAVGPRKAQEIVHRIAAKTSTGFHMLKNVPPEQIVPFISHEHPQTIALILTQLEATLGSGILAQLPEKLQADVSYRMATMENITPAVIRQIEESLEASLRDILGGNQNVGGPKVVADILNLTGASVEKNVLEQMDAQVPEVAESVRNMMFTFDDIAGLGDYDIQVLIGAVSQGDLAIALKAAKEQLKNKILHNVSQEQWQAIKDEMEYAGPMLLSDVEEVQLRIVQQVRQLEEQGQLRVIRNKGDDQYV